MIVSLTACLDSVVGSDSDRGLWKWAILALHNALQGAMVCHLSGTAQLGALSQGSARDWLDWHDRDRKGEIKRVALGTDDMGVPNYRIAKGYEPPSDRLADARELFRRLSNASKRIEPGAGGVIEITSSERESFRRIHDLRNGLSHFTPKGWSIELDGLPAIFLDVLDVIERIAGDPWPFRHMQTTDNARRDALIGRLRDELEAAEARYQEDKR